MKKEIEVQKSPTVADGIWNEIKGKELPMFAITGKSVADYCERVEVMPDKLYLKLKVPAVLPMLEELFSKKFDIAMGTLYCEISRKPEAA